jgi:hypothetical protein
VSKLARLMAQEEGFGIAGAVPTIRNNPGDLTHAPGEVHAPNDPNGVGSFQTAEEGWDALERQLQIFADHHMTLRAAIYTYAPPSQNDSERYLNFICEGLGCTPDTPVAEALKL